MTSTTLNGRNSGYQIRLAEVPDLPAIQAIVEAAYTPYIPLIGKPPAPMTADYASLISTSSLYILLHLTTNTIIGCIALESSPTTTENNSLATENNSPIHVLEINNLAVDPNFQGKGLGRLLMAFAEEEAKKRGVIRLELYTNVKMVGNLKMYAKLGFDEVERRSEDGFERVFFRKEV